MTGNTHFALGVSLGLTTAPVLFPENIPAMAGYAAAVAVGSLFPDIDSKCSKLSRKIPIISFFVRLFFGHRGAIHTPFFWLILSLPIVFLGNDRVFMVPVWIGFSLGYFCHLLQDSMTRRGIMWMYPLSGRYYRIFRLKSHRLLMIEQLLTFLLFLAFSITIRCFAKFS